MVYDSIISTLSKFIITADNDCIWITWLILSVCHTAELNDCLVLSTTISLSELLNFICLKSPHENLNLIPTSADKSCVQEDLSTVEKYFTFDTTDRLMAFISAVNYSLTLGLGLGLS